jgi:hypothetical protein
MAPRPGPENPLRARRWREHPYRVFRFAVIAATALDSAALTAAALARLTDSRI